MAAERKQLHRVRDRHNRTLFYTHPHGWRIKREERDWDARGLGGMAADPKVYWEVRRSNQRRSETFHTLTDARAWCDENKSWPDNRGRQDDG